MIGSKSFDDCYMYGPAVITLIEGCTLVDANSQIPQRQSSLKCLQIGG